MVRTSAKLSLSSSSGIELYTLSNDVHMLQDHNDYTSEEKENERLLSGTLSLYDLR